MAVTDQTPANASLANGITNVFPYTFRILAEEDLRVTGTLDGVTTEYTVNVDYTVSDVGGASGGNVTFNAPPASGTTVLRKRAMSYTRAVDYQASGDLIAEELNDDQDAPVMMVQQLAEAVDRCLIVPEHLVGAFDAALPTPVALKPLVVNAAGTAFEMGDTELSGDLLLRGNLSSESTDSGYNSDLVTVIDTRLADAVAVSLRKKWEGAELNVLTTFIPSEYHAAIRDHTSTVDVSGYIQNAIDAVTLLSPGARLYFPSGRYLLGATILCPDRLSIRGDGWCAGWNGSSVAEPRGTVFRMKASSNCDAFRQDGKSTRYSLQFADFCIDGDGTNQSSNVGPDATYSIYQFNRNGFFFEALYNTTWTNVRCQNMRGSGWVIHGDASTLCTNFFLDHCSAYNCRVYCVNFRGAATDGHVNHGDFGFGRAACISLDSPSHTLRAPICWTSQCQDLADANTHSTGTGAVSDGTGGIRVNGANCRLIDVTSEGHAGHGIKVTGNANQSEIRNPSVYFVASSVTTSGLFDGIDVDQVTDLLIVDPIVRNSSTATTTIRRAITLEAGHTRVRIRGGDLRRLGAAAAEVTGQVVSGFSWASGDKSDFAWANSEVKAYSAVANSIGTGATKVQFRTETTDTRGEWDITTDTFTAAEAGVYRIDTGVSIANTTDGNSFTLSLYKNGSEYRRLGQQRAGAGASVQIVGGLEMKLEAGDTIDIRGICGTATNTNVGAVLTWIEITQING